MKNRNAHDGIIATADLSSVNVPHHDVELEVLETFCLTIDGYEGGRQSVEDLVSQADRLERDGLENATLDELRLVAFIRQRELRWTTYGDDVADAPLIAKIRRTVAEIRRRVA
jgi:hypothetical protein